MYDNLRKMIRQSGNIVFFGGAGVSTESGIPDFRSESGIFNAKQKYGLDIEELLSHHFFAEKPEVFFDYYKSNLIVTQAKPNEAHLALAKLEAQGKLKAVITQNIDGLHQAAGSKTVWELHGSVARNYCTNCGAAYSLAYTLEPANCEGPVPKCGKCGGLVRPDVVLYEEMLDEAVMNGAISAICKADTLIVGGTSLVVYPAAGLIRYFSGENLILINKSSTPYDNQAQLVIHDSIGTVLSSVV